MVRPNTLPAPSVRRANSAGSRAHSSSVPGAIALDGGFERQRSASVSILLSPTRLYERLKGYANGQWRYTSYQRAECGTHYCGVESFSTDSSQRRSPPLTSMAAETLLYEPTRHDYGFNRATVAKEVAFDAGSERVDVVDEM